MKDKINILLVDDELGLRLTLKQIFEMRGYDVTAAANGQQAIEEAKKKKFHLLLSDIKMPGMNGVETFIKIKEIDPHITAIMMTGYAMQEEIKIALQEGAYTVLNKPLDLEGVFETIEESLNDRVLVMLVDSLAEGQQPLDKKFEEKGFRVIRVSNEQQCLAEIKSRKFQVIIFDVDLNGKHGFEIMKDIRQVRPDVGIVILTGESEEEWVDEAMNNSSYAMVHKPVDVEKLIDIVEHFKATH